MSSAVANTGLTSPTAASVCDLRTGSLPRAPWLVVFDLDGTLIDSSEDLCASVNAALAHIGRRSLSPDAITGFIGDGAASLVRRALAATGHEIPGPHAAADHEILFDRTFRFFLEFYREHKLDTTTAYPGVLKSLQTMHERRPDLLMAVLTNKPVNPSRVICEALGLSPFFFAIYGGNSFATKKPAPEGLLTLIEEARGLLSSKGMAAEDLASDGVVMVGDAPPDVLAARACGALSLGCLHGLAPDALLATKPDLIARTPDDWPAALDFRS